MKDLCPRQSIPFRCQDQVSAVLFYSTREDLPPAYEILQNYSMNLPVVKNYLDCYQYLEDVYNYHKKRNPEFSYQAWSEQLNVKSKSFLRSAILGKKKISAELCERLAQWLNLSPTDQQHFILLVEYTQCSLPDIKRILSQKLLHEIRLDQQSLPLKVENLSLADPLFVQIRDVLSFKDVRHTPTSLARLFNQPQPVIEEALNYLEKIQWVQKDADLTWSATENSVKIEDDHGNSLLQEFHERSLTQAIGQARTPTTQRKYRSLSLTLSDSEFAELHGRVSEMMTVLFNEYSQSPNSLGKKLFQVNYNISPRTETITDEK